MQQKENFVHQSDPPVLNSPKWPKRLTIILTSVLLLTMFGVGGYWLGARRQQSSSTDLLTKPKSSGLPSATLVQQFSPIATITTSQTESKTSPDGMFIVTEETVGDHSLIIVSDSQGNVITDDLLAKNEEEIGYNVKFSCQCATSFKSWVSDSQFAIKIVNGNGEEYEYLVDANLAKVDESTFKRIK
jgi:hypothetical protein